MALLGLGPLLGLGCESSKEPVITYYGYRSKQHNFGFDFPQGWGPPIDREGLWKRPRHDTSLVTITDAAERATISVSAFTRPLRQEETGSRSERLQAILMVLDRTGPTNYERYTLLRRGNAGFAGMFAGVGEIVFESRRGGDAARWNRLLVLVPQDGEATALLVHLSAPASAHESYAKDFQVLEQRWRWSAE